jgi:hypothetical protein
LEAVEKALTDGGITTVGASFASAADAVVQTIVEFRRLERAIGKGTPGTASLLKRIAELEAALAAVEARESRGSCGWCVYAADWSRKWSSFATLKQRATCLHPDHEGLEVLCDLSCDLFKRKEET